MYKTVVTRTVKDDYCASFMAQAMLDVGIDVMGITARPKAHDFVVFGVVTYVPDLKSVGGNPFTLSEAHADSVCSQLDQRYSQLRFPEEHKN